MRDLTDRERDCLNADWIKVAGWFLTPRIEWDLQFAPTPFKNLNI